MKQAPPWELEERRQDSLNIIRERHTLRANVEYSAPWTINSFNPYHNPVILLSSLYIEENEGWNFVNCPGYNELPIGGVEIQIQSSKTSGNKAFHTERCHFNKKLYKQWSLIHEKEI